jgi:hypothetical protein
MIYGTSLMKIFKKILLIGMLSIFNLNIANAKSKTEEMPMPVAEVSQDSTKANSEEKTTPKKKKKAKKKHKKCKSKRKCKKKSH